MLMEGTDLGVGMVIRDSTCKDLLFVIICILGYDSASFEVSDNLLLSCVAVGSSSLRQAWPLYCIMFLLLASNRDIHMEGTRTFPCSFIVNMFSFCSKSKYCSLQTFLAWDLGLEKWCCWGESCKPLSQPVIGKLFSFLYCSTAAAATTTGLPKTSLPRGTCTYWWPPLRRCFSRGRESLWSQMKLNAALRQFRVFFSIFCLLDTFDSLSLVQKPVWPASFCISGLLCVSQGQQILRKGGWKLLRS